MSEDVPLGLLFGLLAVLLLLSAFFSSTETALMSLNRYRLRHRARSGGNHAARLAEKLLQRPERVIGLILLGNNAVNLAAAAIVTVIAIRLGGEAAIFAGTLILTVVVLIFAEVTPKTIAARYPSKIALPAALVYYPLLKLVYPIVWVVSCMANGLLWLIGIRGDRDHDALSEAELRTLVTEAGSMMPRRHKRMLLSILDLGEITVDDIMVPRQEIAGVDLDEPWESNLDVIRKSRYSRLPVYRGDIDNIVGVVHLRSILPDLAQGNLSRELLLGNTQEPYFVPEGTPLNKQLMNFERLKQRFAFAVDEYGDIQGLLTIEDVLREIVGEFDTESGSIGPEVRQEQNNVFIVHASANIRQLNRLMTWDLPTNGPKTLNGQIIEELETIPDPGAKLTLDGYELEILETAEHAIKRVRITVPKRPVLEPRLSATG